MASGLFFSLLLVCCCLGPIAGRLSRRHVLRAPPAQGSVPPPAQWLEQRLDHFNASDARTWKQRYWVNASHWRRASGPVFLLISGESEANPVWLTTGDMMTNAAKYGAMAVTLEHRYYGLSRPTPDLSAPNLQWLSSRQALQDMVALKASLQAQLRLSPDNKWVSFGGSYSGALSAWLRIKYPEAVVGAVASSAPVQAEEDFVEYLEVVSASLATATAGLACDAAIKNATSVLEAMLQDKAQWPAVEKTFNIHPPLQSAQDLNVLAEALAGPFMDVVQYNRDNTAFEGRDNNVTIDDLCSVMADVQRGPPLARYAAVAAMMSGYSPLDVSFSAEVIGLSATSWDSPAAMGERQWYYQTCTEFGYYQTTDSPSQPFGSLMTLPSFTSLCSLAFSLPSTAIADAVAATNAYYGGRKLLPNASNIVFPNGSIDPWHALGVTANLSSSLTAIFIEGTAHCANMYPPSAHDPPGLALARQEISTILGQWLKH